MEVLSIDPGTEVSAWCVWDGERVLDMGNQSNEKMLERLVYFSEHLPMVVEMVASYGKPVGKETFETCVWIGRFCQAWPYEWHRLYRNDVKMHLCHATAKVKDSMVRQAIIDRCGPGKAKAIGTVKSPGPLHGVSGDVWQALGLAITWHDLNAVTLETRA